MAKKYRMLKVCEKVEKGDMFRLFHGSPWQDVSLSIGHIIGKYDFGYFRREIKQKPHQTKTKISRLKKSFLKGKSFTPVSAGKAFGMQHNTFNKFIWVLKHEHGMEIKSDWVKGKTYKRHWVEKIIKK